jgi:hypothetical protein
VCGANELAASAPSLSPDGCTDRGSRAHSFTDGVVLSCLCNALGERIDIDSLSDALADTTVAMQVALDKHDIPTLLEPADMVRRAAGTGCVS